MLIQKTAFIFYYNVPRVVLSIICFLFILNPAYSQNNPTKDAQPKLSGNVSNSEHKCIQYAYIEAYQNDYLKAYCSTDTDGMFTISLPDTGVYEFRVSSTGYDLLLIPNIRVATINTNIIDVVLTRTAYAPTIIAYWKSPLSNISLRCPLVSDSDGMIPASTINRLLTELTEKTHKKKKRWHLFRRQ